MQIKCIRPVIEVNWGRDIVLVRSRLSYVLDQNQKQYQYQHHLHHHHSHYYHHHDTHIII